MDIFGGLLPLALSAFVAFFAISNPLEALPVYLTLTRSADEQTTRAVALRSVLVAFGVMTAFALLGQYIFHAFGITLAAFRIAGGILVFLAGFQMLQDTGPDDSDVSPQSVGEFTRRAMGGAVSPLAVPLLAGPGAIAAAMTFTGRGGLGTIAVVIAAFAAVCALAYLVFRLGKRLLRILGENGMLVVARLMGLILAVIGAQMVLTGLTAAF